jgi:hypothetical protein
MILFRLGLDELAVKKKFVNLSPEPASLSILGHNSRQAMKIQGTSIL